MKKILTILLIGLLTLPLQGCFNKKEKVNDNEQKNIEQKDIHEFENETLKKQGDLEFTEVKIEESGATSVVTAKVENKGNDTVDLVATFIMKNKEKNMIFGQNDITIENLTSGEIRDINISIVGDYKEVDSFEITSKIIK